MNLGRVRVSEAALPYAMAALAGSAAAVMTMLAPASELEALVGESGLPAVLAAAQPPLGLTARALLAAAVALLAAAAAFTGLRSLEGLPRISTRKFTKFTHRRGEKALPPEAETPVVRKPIFAEAELGAPFNSVVAAAPKRLEAAVPTFVREVESEVVIEPEPAPVLPPCEAQSIAELVARLEAGMQRRRGTVDAKFEARPSPAPDMDAALRDALGTLQRMTARSRA